MDVKISYKIQIKINQSINMFINKNITMEKSAFCAGLPAKCFNSMRWRGEEGQVEDDLSLILQYVKIVHESGIKFVSPNVVSMIK